MSSRLYACVHAVEFPAQALLRLRPDLGSKPVVVLEGRAPDEVVCSLNRRARRHGAVRGMTRTEVEAVEGLRLLKRSPAAETAARAVLLECAAQFSPRIEEASRATACAFLLDIAGTERLFGPPERLAARLRASLAEARFHASVVISANYDAARMQAAATRGTILMAPGHEARVLEDLPIAALELDEPSQETFLLWGVRTLGEVARLPEIELVARLGAEARRWRQLACGQAEHMFQPIEPKFSLEEFCAFETPVDQSDSLLFIGARMIDCLVGRARTRALALAQLTVEMELEGQRLHSRVLRPATPSTDRKFLLDLVRLDLGAHPPNGAVLALRLTARAAASAKVQLGLFVPQTPEPSRLDLTLARLKGLVGEDRVGSPVLDDTHRQGGFHVENFQPPTQPVTDTRGAPSRAWTAPRSKPQALAARTALRRLRPAAPVWMVERTGRPAAFGDRQSRFEVMAAYGPWRTSGGWWSSSESWDEEEWDVLASKSNGDSVACVLVCDRRQSGWRLEAYYD
jgi:protein ImuB